MKIYYDSKADALEILGASERLPIKEANYLTFNIANLPKDLGRISHYKAS